MKKIIWMQGFNHFPEFSGVTPAEKFKGFLNRFAILPGYECNIASAAKIGTMTFNGVSHKGLLICTQGTQSVFSVSIPWAGSNTGKRVYYGARVSASDTVQGADLAVIKNDASTMLATIKAYGKNDDYFIECVVDTEKKVASLYANRTLIGTVSKYSTSNYLNFFLGSDATYSRASKSGIGICWSDFYYAEEEIDGTQGEPDVYGNIFIDSQVVSTFEGNNDYYNTMGIDIVEGLNAVIDINYAESSGYLHVPESVGTLTYTPADFEASTAVAAQISSYVLPSFEDFEIKSDVFINGIPEETTKSKVSSESGAYYTQYDVINREVSVEEINSLSVKIESITR